MLLQAVIATAKSSESVSALTRANIAIRQRFSRTAGPACRVALRLAVTRQAGYPVIVQPAVFLDRDNTLIHNDSGLGDPEQVRLCEGVPTGLRSLRESGYSLVVVTNQAGVARGKFTEADVDSVHQRIATLVDAQARSFGLIDRFYYCPYHPDGTVDEYRRDHPWRKPHPGMILQAARDMGIDLAESWMIGDQERDIQ